MATGSSTLVKVDSDGGLVLGTLAGDRATFAALYDRFAAPIYDLHLALLRDPALAAEASHQTFQRAVANLNHLGEPSQLRPWLYSMVYRQGKPSGASAAASGGPQSRPGDDPQAVIWRAVPELNRLDRALFTLHLRHGLDFSEIGTIVGMSADRARSRLDKLRVRLDPALRPLLQSRLAPPRRPGGPPNRPPPSFDELLASHPTPLRVAVPLATPPAALRERVLREIPLITAHQGLPRPRTRAAWITTVASVLVIVMGTALFVHRNMERKPVVAVTFGPSSELSLSTTVIDLGATNSTSTVTLDNTGKNRLSWRTDPGAPWLKVQPASGSLDGGQSQELTVVADRGALPQEGDGRTQLKVSAADGQGEAEVSVALREERPPAIINPRASSTRIGGFGCPTVATISATIRDESPPVRVVLVGPGQQTQPMQPSGETYSGRIGSGSGANVVWKIIATDSRNNTATSPAQVIANADCMARPSPKPPPSASLRPSVSSRPSTGATGRSTSPDDSDSPGSTGRRTPSNGDDGDSPGSGSGRGEDPYGGGRFGF
ncbi:BACON domain-containing protein [Pseudonocardia acaciae]|uniref:BACON domain-containing protein n=1 Tax=Pseudonocardia acaciae TaxID=551276 RepID=UPI0012ED54B3|nr:hypothetical protein [Pseudonocardia acaciae]